MGRGIYDNAGGAAEVRTIQSKEKIIIRGTAYVSGLFGAQDKRRISGDIGNVSSGYLFRVSETAQGRAGRTCIAANYFKVISTLHH